MIRGRMQIVDHLEASTHPPVDCVVTIGNFDGVHLGHRSVIRSLEEEAARIGAAVALVTFEPHTLEVIRPELAPRLLTSTVRKVELLDETGIDYLAIVTFDTERAVQPAEEFVEEILVGRLRAREIMVGADFRFGHKARGDIALLERLGAQLGFGVTPIELVAGPHGTLSSTAIRKAVREGRLEEATEGLGRPHEIRGEVVHGDQRGRLLGFPTANVVPGPKLCVPPTGVYAGKVRRPDAVWYDAVINFGVRPTFRSSSGDGASSEPVPVVEAHLFDFDGDLYGEIVDVAFVAKLRDEKRFSGVEALTDQIAADSAQARERLASPR